MSSNLDRLREGQPIEISPGVSGRLNREKKTLQLSTGQVLDASENADLFPHNEQALSTSRHKEKIEKGIKGPIGEFWHQYSHEGIPGGVRDILDFAGQDYISKKQAQKQVSERISEESPYLSGAATAANIGTDIALTRGMSALKAAPLLTAGSAGSRLFTEPTEVAGEAALVAGGGWLADKSLGWLNKVKDRRAASQALPGQQQAVRNANIAGAQNVANANTLGAQNVKNTNAAQAQQFQASQQATQNANTLGAQNVKNANAIQTQQFQTAKQAVKNTNEARLQTHQDLVDTYKNKIASDKAEYIQKQSLRDAEVIRLKNQASLDKAQRSSNIAKSEAEYKAAKEAADAENRSMLEKFKIDQANYEKSLKELPDLQRKAQAEYSQNVVKSATEIERSFPKNSKISTSQLELGNFIDESIDKTGLAGSREGNQAKRILNSLFPEGEMLGGRELSKRYKALEDAIQRSDAEVQSVLSNFKQHLGQRLPAILENSVVYGKVAPLLQKTIEKDVRSILSEIPFEGTGADKIKNTLTQSALSRVKEIIKNESISPDFSRKLQSGELSRDIANKILSADDFFVDVAPSAKKALQKQGLLEYVFDDAKQKHAYFVDTLAKKLDEKLARYEVKAFENARNATNDLGKNLRKTYGLAEQVPTPSRPIAQEPIAYGRPPAEVPELPPVQMPEGITLPSPPPAPPQTPSLLPNPTQPTPQTFTPQIGPTAPVPQTFTPQTFAPQAEPSLAPAQGLSERAGDFLEKDLLGGRGLLNNPLTKLGGLKYLLGKGALPLEAGYVGMKALTSPTAFGEGARETFKQGGIQAIMSWAEKYPSYHDGILENPQERRSLTKEIEDAGDIPLEQKALMQSKINRGKPLDMGL